MPLARRILSDQPIADRWAKLPGVDKTQTCHSSRCINVIIHRATPAVKALGKKTPRGRLVYISGPEPINLFSYGPGKPIFWASATARAILKHFIEKDDIAAATYQSRSQLMQFIVMIPEVAGNVIGLKVLQVLGSLIYRPNWETLRKVNQLNDKGSKIRCALLCCPECTRLPEMLLCSKTICL